MDHRHQGQSITGSETGREVILMLNHMLLIQDIEYSCSVIDEVVVVFG
jgi:hypothetical protein